ncbi:hypothetical protein [Nitrosomonas sp. ANs5]|uniref:hypothetical protein n=1 Tax=Nitrosomonas sp. ANs5 TaxID=3423941 RepID=UPI003D325DEE
MSHFLWVEDFENSPKATASNVLGSVFNDSLFDEDRRALKQNLKTQGVFIELTLQDGLEFITPDLDKKVDYIILDIDLPAFDEVINDELLQLLETFENYQKHEDETDDEEALQTVCSELKKIAGFYLYTKLVVELGFPKRHILFCSNHANQTKSILEAFKTAKIALPKIYEKADPFVQDWTKDRYQNPYSRLRRGIIEACRELKEKLNNPDFIYFNNYIPKQESTQTDDIISYFEILENFLPLREPDPKDKKSLYKLFIRTLSHEWEAAKNIRHDKNKPDAVLAWVMRNTRHWITHNSNLFSDVDEQLIAYLFILNIRVMFNWNNFEVLKHEEILFSIFDFNRKDLETNEFLKNLPISTTYLDLKNLIKKANQCSYQTINIEDSFYFNEMANNIQLSKSIYRNDKELFVKLLYQMFWLLTCNPFVDKKNNYSLEIKFWNFKYSDKPYMLELARRIYHRSFPKV